MSLITSIQKYSIHDGDGIRTTVFFKGCGLRCVWCHNPEGLLKSTQIMYNESRCIGCGACVHACENSCHLINNKILHILLILHFYHIDYENSIILLEHLHLMY